MNLVQNKKVWVLHQEGTTPKTGYGGRTYYFAKELSERGYQVHYIVSPSTHMHKVKHSLGNDISSWKDGKLNVVYLTTLKYDRASSYKRILGWFQFVFKARRLIERIGSKPDVVLVSTPSLISAISGRVLQCKTKAKLVLDVRDLWPTTLVELGGISSSHPLIVLMRWCEKYLYTKVDHIVSNLPLAFEYMKDFGVKADKFTWISNGVALNEFESATSLPEGVNNKLVELAKDKFVIGYTGSLGRANNLNYLVNAAVKMKSNENVIFVLFGEGEEKQKLQSLTCENALENVYFFDAVEKQMIPSVHKFFDVGYIGWGDHDLYKYGTAPNKLSEYMYSKLPILNSFSGGYDYVTKHNCGLTVEAENVDEIVSGITYLQALSNEQLKQMGSSGYHAVTEFYTYRKLCDQYEQVLNAL